MCAYSEIPSIGSRTRLSAVKFEGNRMHTSLLPATGAEEAMWWNSNNCFWCANAKDMLAVAKYISSPQRKAEKSANPQHQNPTKALGDDKRVVRDKVL